MQNDTKVGIQIHRLSFNKLCGKRNTIVKLINPLMKPGYVYILASERNGTLYTGVTNNLLRRIEEHKSGRIEGFSKKYNCKICVYYEYFENIELAIMREKQLKGGSRKKKLELIEKLNPEWEDLTNQIKELI